MKKNVKRIFAALLAFTLVFSLLSITVSAETDPKVYIIDSGGYLSDDLIYPFAKEIAEQNGMNIMIVVSDDIGEPKTDAHTVEYADDLYDQYCGINTDGVLFLMNNDTKYDYISTSGSAINYYSDYRIDRILDDTYDYLVNGDYNSAALTFINDISYYYKSGKANHQTEIFGSEAEIEDFFATLIFMMLIAVVIGMFIFIGNKKKFQIQKTPASIYVNKNTFKLTQNTDTFMGTITSRVYSPQSSGSGSGHSGRSSTHHSSGGGRHGGGGRHR